MAADRDRQSDLAVMDVNEFKQKRRLEAVLDAHDAVQDKADEAMDLYTIGEISAQARDVMLLHAVQRFIREVYNLVDDTDEVHADYWEGRDLGTLQRNYADDVNFCGLQDVLHAQNIYHDLVREDVQTPCGPDEVKHERREHTVPEDVIWRAYLLAKEFLDAEHGLSLDFTPHDDGIPEVDGIEVVPQDDGGDSTNGTGE